MYVLVGIAVLILALIAYASTKPDTARYVRSTTVAAAPESLFSQVIDLHKWDAWSPWAKLDPDMKVTYEGPESGPGSTYHWVSQKKNVGAGNMTITGAAAPRTVNVQVNFLKPFKGEGAITFTFDGGDSSTTVTWAMDSKNTLMSKIMSVFINMDKMIGADFDKGLAALKAVAEGRA